MRLDGNFDYAEMAAGFYWASIGSARSRGGRMASRSTSTKDKGVRRNV